MKRRIFALLFAVLLASSLFLPLRVLAQSPLVGISFSALTDGKITVSVTVGPVENLTELLLHIRYDTTVFSLESVAPATVMDSDGDTSDRFSGLWQNGLLSDGSGCSVAFISAGTTKTAAQPFCFFTFRVKNGYAADTSLSAFLCELTTDDGDETTDCSEPTLLSEKSYTITDADRFSCTASGSAATLTAYRLDESRITVPETLNGNTVTSLGTGLFSGFSLACIQIPETVTSIAAGALNAAGNNILFCRKGSAAALYAAANSILCCSYSAGVQLDLQSGFLITNAYHPFSELAVYSGSSTVTASFKNGTALERSGTGSTLTLTAGSSETVLTLVETGDLNGDGICDSFDIAASESTGSSHTVLSAAAEKAADLNGDGSLTSADYTAIVNRVLSS